jgi:hypothetical protein
MRKYEIPEILEIIENAFEDNISIDCWIEGSDDDSYPVSYLKGKSYFIDEVEKELSKLSEI